MARYGTTDLDEAVAREMEEAGVRGFTRDEILQSVIDEERSKLMGGKVTEGTCLEEGCDKPRREGKARCDEHQKALQNATYQRTKGKKPVKAAHHKEAKEPVIARVTDTDGSVYEAEIKNPPPIPDGFVDKMISISPGELLSLVARVRGLKEQKEASAFMQGYLAGRRIA